MSTVVEAINHLFNFPETLDKFLLNSSSRAGEGAGSVANDSRGGVGSLPAVDILDSPKAYVFYVDVPGLSKSDIQVIILHPQLCHYYYYCYCFQAKRKATY